MAYLLHPTSFTAASNRPEHQEGAAGGVSLFAPLRSLVQGIQTVLHGEPSRAASPQTSSSRNSTVAAATAGLTPGSQQSASLPSSNIGSIPATLLVASRDTAGAGNLHRAKGFPSASRQLNATALPSTPAPAASAATTQHQQPRKGSLPTAAGSAAFFPDAAPVTDASLYSRAVDYADLEEVLRCPLPPVAGCPTPCAFGGTQATSTNCSTPGTAQQGTGASTKSSAPSSPSPPPLTFRCIAADADTGITVYSTPVEECPMHLMRAYTILPCSPEDVLQYMDNDVRPQWDTYIRRSAMLRTLAPPEMAAQVAEVYQLSSSIGTAKAGVGQQHPTSMSARNREALLSGVPEGSSSLSSMPPSQQQRTLVASSDFAYKPGQRRVAIHYLETRSPVPFVQDRDFELVVAEEIRHDGTAYTKAFSTPFGYHMPLDPQQSRYVRAVVLLSGMVARPLDAASVEQVLPPVLRRQREALLKSATQGSSSKRGLATTLKGGSRPSKASPQSPTPLPSLPLQYCVLEYVGLVHPMGLLPAVLVNVVISAQLNAMRKMQAFIAKHPISTVRPPRLNAETLNGGGAGMQATIPPLRELSAALRAAAPLQTKGTENSARGAEDAPAGKTSSAAVDASEKPKELADDKTERTPSPSAAASEGRPDGVADSDTPAAPPDKKDLRESATAEAAAGQKKTKQSQQTWWGRQRGRLFSRL